MLRNSLFLLSALLVQLSFQVDYTIEYFETYVDHFSNAGVKDGFQMRYLVNQKHYVQGGPILFYAGNEGAITQFYNNSGFMTDTLAEAWGGLVIFGEHRYFGETYPTDQEDAFNPYWVQFLTVEQTMMDYNILMFHVREKFNVQDAACIVFGGSYGGMLAAWTRMKYPHNFQGALAASAPTIYFQGAEQAMHDQFSNIITWDFANQTEACPEIIKEGWGYMAKALMFDEEWTEIGEIFKTCDAISSKDDLQGLYTLLTNGYAYMAMTDYPYESNFLEPMPGFPIVEACKAFDGIVPLSKMSEKEVQIVKSEKSVEGSYLTDRQKVVFEALAVSTNVYFNSSGQIACQDLSNTEGTGSLDGYGWNALACNQLAMPIGNKADSMFLNTPFDYDSYTRMCKKEFGLSPQWQWPLTYFGGFNLARDYHDCSNIIYSNGILDPWLAGGVNEIPGQRGNCLMFTIDGGAHHLDLRLPNAEDPQDVTFHRQLEQDTLKSWIDAYDAKVKEINSRT